MQLNRFFVKFDPTKRHLRIEDVSILSQVRKVLRLGIGDQFVLFDGDLNEAEMRITGFGKGVVECEILKVTKNTNEPDRYVGLYCSILKRNNFELVVQKATEIGISEIVPLVCKRTVKLNIRSERLEKIVQEAAEQAGRGIIPKLEEPVEFNRALKSARKNKENLFFDPSGKKLNSETVKQLNRVGVWVGPEGGWDRVELDQAKRTGLKIISLGELTLRAETAAVIASYLGVNNL